jgi:hypothetical protein
MVDCRLPNSTILIRGFRRQRDQSHEEGYTVEAHRYPEKEGVEYDLKR